MLAGDTDRVAWPRDQGTSRGRVSQLTKNSSKIGSPADNRAWDAGRDLSEVSELAKSENHHILYLVDRWLTPRTAVSRREAFVIQPILTLFGHAPQNESRLVTDAICHEGAAKEHGEQNSSLARRVSIGSARRRT